MTSAATQTLPKRMGRPPFPWTEELEDQILNLIADGESLSDICKLKGMPHASTVMKRLGERGDFTDRYACARQLQADLLDGRIMQAAEETTQENAQAMRVKIDAYKWRASKLAPHTFGDKLDLTTQGEKITAPQPVTLIDARIQSLAASVLGSTGTAGLIADSSPSLDDLMD